MKVIDTKYVDAPVEFYDLRFSPEELQYIRYLAAVNTRASATAPWGPRLAPFRKAEIRRKRSLYTGEMFQ
jgi:hypothetical protein